MSIWVILGLVAWLLLILLFVGDDKYLPSFWLLVIPGAIIAYTAWEAIFAWVSGVSTATLVVTPLVYVACGFGVALVKWTFRSSKAAQFVATELKDVHRSLADINYDLMRKYKGLKVSDTDGVKTLGRSNAFGDVIWSWVFWWPFVLVASLISDFIYEFIRMVTRWMGGTFQAITDYFFNQANKGN